MISTGTKPSREVTKTFMNAFESFPVHCWKFRPCLNLQSPGNKGTRAILGRRSGVEGLMKNRSKPSINLIKDLSSATRQTTYFCTWLIASFPSLIRRLLPYLEARLLFIHDMASISTYFSLFSTFSYGKAVEKAQKSIFPCLWWIVLEVSVVRVGR